MNIALFIHGKSSSGKDFFVKGLKIYFFTKNENFPKPFSYEKLFSLDFKDPQIIITMPFADEVRKELCALNPEIDFDKLCHDYAYKERYRKELIEIGDGYRKKNPGVWVEAHYSALKKWHGENNGKIVCIPDLRYATNDLGSEFDYSKEINEWGGIISLRIKIKAPLVTRLNRMSPEGVFNYMKYGFNNPSENSMDHLPDSAFDYVCDNSNNYSSKSLPASFLQVYQEIFELWKKVKDFR